MQDHECCENLIVKNSNIPHDIFHTHIKFTSKDKVLQ